MADASFEVQKAIYSALSSGLSVKVYDDVPGSANPSSGYVVIGSVTAIPDESKTDMGESLTVTLHSWKAGRSRKVLADILGAIRALLHRQPLTVAGFDVHLVRQEFQEAMKEAPKLYHGVQRFRVDLAPQ